MQREIEEPTIRPFRREDQDVVAKMFRDNITGISGDETSDLYKCHVWFADSKLEKGGDMHDIAEYYLECGVAKRHFWVAELGGKIVGCVGCKESDRSESMGELVRMSVDPCARGCGLGSRLCGVVEGFIASLGMSMCELTTLREMVGAVALYQRNQYENDLVIPLDLTKESKGAVQATSDFAVYRFVKPVASIIERLHAGDENLPREQRVHAETATSRTQADMGDEHKVCMSSNGENVQGEESESVNKAAILR